LSLYAWYADNADAPPYVPGTRGTHPVGSKKPNPWGVYDMQGNIWQWCADKFGAARMGVHYYAHSPLEDPQGPDKVPLEKKGPAQRVMRGNCWEDAGRGVPMSHDSRAAHRFGANPGQIDARFGFRVCVRPVAEK
jgi:formylglycine-generating enzyme required for sulfatase activity